MAVHTIRIKTDNSSQIIDITDNVNKIIAKEKVSDGLCNIFTTHTTCALTTGEMGEGTAQDFLEVAQKIIPNISFRHGHDPSHAWTHMASSLIGTSLTLPIKDGELLLGTWQSVLLVELDGPRERNLVITIV
ncbi:YjbQ family protein [Candidatus Gottesmanbacteria bacterium]|nr:YjbQ family protein [Candidatus Gottesmanbacteria bacterium]